MPSFLSDIRFAARMLTRAPRFTAVAVFVLALGIGVNTTVFTVINAVLLRPLAYVQHPERLVWMTRVVSYPAFLEFRERNTSFSAFTAFLGATFIVGPVGGNDSPELTRGQYVTGEYFETLGVPAALGRTLAAEDAGGAKPVAVISDRLWQRQFERRPDVVGGLLTVNSVALTIVGVTPRGFVDEVGQPHDLWVPLTVHPLLSPGESSRAGQEMLEDRDTSRLNVVGRLKPGVDVGRARAEIARLAEQLVPPRSAGDRARPVTLLQWSGGLDPRDRQSVAPVGQMLMGLVGIILLIACANVANLLLARGAARQKEIAIRQTLGASRSRLVRQLLAESLLLAVIAGGAGLLLSMWSADLLQKVQLPTAFPVIVDLGPDARVLVFTLLASIATGVVFGLAPALQAVRPELVAALHDNLLVGGHAYRPSRLRSTLVGAQVALSVVVLVAAGLFVRSLLRITAVDPGVAIDDRLVMPINAGAYAEARGSLLYREVTDRVGAMRAVQSAALVRFAPLTMSGSGEWAITVEGQTEKAPHQEAGANIVSPRYFETLGIPIVRGRAFDDRDRAGSAGVVIVTETMARRFWPGQDALGRRLKSGGRWLEVVGIARDSSYRSIGELPSPHMYLPLLQHYQPRMTLVVHARGDSRAMMLAVRQEVQRVSGAVPVADLRTFAQAIEAGMFPTRAGAALLTILGLLALTLAAAGVYGVSSYAVSQRTREIGIRIALGGRREDILRLMIGDGLRPVAIGAVVGLVLSVGLAQLLPSLLLGLSPLDPVTFAVVPALLGSIASLATYLPARRATKVEPVRALHCE